MRNAFCVTCAAGQRLVFVVIFADMAHPCSERKLTEHINFGKAFSGIPENVSTFVHDITRRRQGIEEALQLVDNSCETVLNSMKEYVAMRTTLKSILLQVKDSSRLRFKWFHFLEEHKTVSRGVEFDMASVITAAGLWHMEHAQMISKSISLEEENDEKMKEVLQSFKTAAGLFDCVKTWEGIEDDSKDLSADTMTALSQQCLAEGQCVTIRRAVQKGHKASLISQLCHDVSQKYSTAAKDVNASDHLQHKWAAYLRFQGEFYLTLSRCYQGVHLLEEEEKCGDSIAVLSECLKHIQQAHHLSKDYDKTKPKTKLSLDEAPTFQRMKNLVTEKIKKSERENSLIYHQRVPEECPPLLEPKCVVHATAFQMPEEEDLTRTSSVDSEMPEKAAAS